MIALVRTYMQTLVELLELHGISVSIVTVEADGEVFILLREATDDRQGE